MHYFQSCSAQCRGSLNKATLGINRRTFSPWMPENSMTQVWREHKPKHLHSFSSLRLSVALRIFSVLCCSELCSCFRAAVTFPFQSLFIIAIYPVSSQTFQLDFSSIFPPHNSRTTGRCSAVSGTWFTTWSSGDPKSSLGPCPRMSSRSWKRKWLPKLIMATGLWTALCKFFLPESRSACVRRISCQWILGGFFLCLELWMRCLCIHTSVTAR